MIEAWLQAQAVAPSTKVRRIASLQRFFTWAVLFRARGGRRVSYHVLYYHWHQLCCTAGLLDERGKPRYSLHQLRHTRGTELIESRQPLEIAQRALGHRDPRSTQGYAEISDIRLRAALENRGQR